MSGNLFFCNKCQQIGHSYDSKLKNQGTNMIQKQWVPKKKNEYTNRGTEEGGNREPFVEEIIERTISYQQYNN